MIDLKELDKTIECLNKIKKEEEQKQLEKLKLDIKNEIYNKIYDELLDFGSEAMLKFRKEIIDKVCFDFNFDELMKILNENIKVDVWEV